VVARNEGIFVEPASAAAIAGLSKCCKAADARYSFREIPARARIVCTVTGHGLKDPDPFVAQLGQVKPVRPISDEVLGAIGL
jgi:threonine synthase